LTFPHLAVETAAAIGVAVVAVWVLSLPLRNASIADIFWPLGFVLVAAVSSRAPGYGPRKVLVGVLVTIWGLRLAVHLFLRNRGHGEDPRYRSMRRRWGESRFPVVSLFTVFLFQGALMWIVSLPIQAASGSSARITWLDVLGSVVWFIGFTFEAVGDLQLTRFRTDPANQRRVMDGGLWTYTRHPNYFGNATLWWGLGLITLAAGRWWALAGPLVMTILLLRVSGVPLLERRMKRTRPDYESYVARTSSFLPLPPKERVKR
jgi:steroid 5-alpha reductase family enzyme